ARAVGTEGATPDTTARRPNVTRQGSTARTRGSRGDAVSETSFSRDQPAPTRRAVRLLLALPVLGRSRSRSQDRNGASSDRPCAARGARGRGRDPSGNV